MNVIDHTLRRILVVKTSTAECCRLNLDQLGSMFPDALLTLWTEERESEEFYSRPDVDRIVLYKNLSAIPRMVRELKGAQADLIVVQSTADPDYFKMHVFAAIFTGQSWLVMDRVGGVQGSGGFFTKLETIAWSFFGNVHPALALIRSSFLVSRQLARLLAAPLVVLGLLIKAARHSVVRYQYLRRQRSAANLRRDG